VEASLLGLLQYLSSYSPPLTTSNCHSFNCVPKDIVSSTKDGGPVEEKEIPYSEIKKGYEIEKDNYVIIEKNDPDKIKLKTTKSIGIKEFVDSKELDTIIIEKSYYVAPDTKRGNDKAYSLLVKILSDTKIANRENSAQRQGKYCFFEALSKRNGNACSQIS
jgi:hypothetical protein